MRLLGLALPEVALLAVGAAAIVLLLHLLRRPERTVVTPALFLWAAVDPDRARKSPHLARLRRIASLLLALSLALLLAFSLGDPERSSGAPARQVIVLIDHSASMASSDVAPSRLAVAKRRAKELVRTLNPRDRALIAAFADDVLPLTTLSEDGAELAHAIDAVAQTDGSADLAVAVDFALDVLRDAPHGELFVLSDGNVRRAELARERVRSLRAELHFELVGEAGRNVAITAATVRHYPLDGRRTETLVTLRNFGARAERGTLTLRTASTLLTRQRFELRPLESFTRILAELPIEADVVEALIALDRGPDFLASDDVAFASVPRRPRTRLLAASADNRYLEAALLLDDTLEVREVATIDPSLPLDDFDLAIVDRVALARPLGIPTLYLGEPNGAYPLARRGVRERPFFEHVEREHALVRGLALEDVNIARAAVVALEPADTVIAGGAQTPLLIAGTRDGAPFVALPFDVRESDLPLRPAWPLLVLRALDRLRGEAPSGLEARTAGEPFSLRVDEPSELFSPDGKRSALLARGDHRLVCERAGVYRLVARGGPPRTLAVLVPAEREGAITPVRALPTARVRAAASGGELPEGRIWPWLVVAALALSLLEWAAFHRRWST